MLFQKKHSKNNCIKIWITEALFFRLLLCFIFFYCFSLFASWLCCLKKPRDYQTSNKLGISALTSVLIKKFKHGYITTYFTYLLVNSALCVGLLLALLLDNAAAKTLPNTKLSPQQRWSTCHKVHIQSDDIWKVKEAVNKTKSKPSFNRFWLQGTNFWSMKVSWHLVFPTFNSTYIIVILVNQRALDIQDSFSYFMGSESQIR